MTLRAGRTMKPIGMLAVPALCYSQLEKDNQLFLTGVPSLECIGQELNLLTVASSATFAIAYLATFSNPYCPHVPLVSR